MISYYKQIQEMNERNFIYVLKFFAVISIVSAHVNSILNNTSQFNYIASVFLQEIAIFGVPIFLIISGYLYSKNKDNLTVFFKKRIKTLIIPWIMTGTVVFLYITLRKGNLNLVSYGNFLIGNGTYLYYLSILFMLYAIFWKLKNKKILIVLLLFCITSRCFGFNFLPNIVPGLNPFNYMHYFIIGILISREFTFLDLAKKVNNKIFLLSIVLFMLISIVNILVDNEYNLSIFKILAGIMILFKLSTIKYLYNNLFISIGKESFAIYLLHMPIAGITVAITNLIGNGLLTLIRPAIVIAIVHVAIMIYKKINIFGIKPEYKNMLIGTR